MAHKYTVSDLRHLWTGLRIHRYTILSVVQPPDTTGDDDLCVWVSFVSQGETKKKLVKAEDVLEAADLHAKPLPRIESTDIAWLGRDVPGKALPLCGATTIVRRERLDDIDNGIAVIVEFPYSSTTWPMLAKALGLKVRDGFKTIDSLEVKAEPDVDADTPAQARAEAAAQSL